MGFSHLHVHTEYSLLDGLGKAEHYAQAAKGLGFEALAVTDHGSVSGAVSFYKACSEAGIKPIIGCEFYVVADPTQKTKGEERYHACVFARNAEGFKDIMEGLTRGHECFYYRPRIGLDQLLAMKNVVVSTACFQGLLRMTRVVDRKIIPALKEAHGDNFYLEIHPHKGDRQEETNNDAVDKHKQYGIPIIAANDCHYPTAEHAPSHEVLLCVQTHKTLPEYRLNPWFSIDGLYLKTAMEMATTFAANHPYLGRDIAIDAILTTQEIVDKCDLKLDKVDTIMPAVPNARQRLRALLVRGMTTHWGTGVPPEYMERIESELEIIERLGFESYFMMVKDLLDWCAKRRIEYGPGRGSVGGSLVAYLIGLHKVDPLKFGLFFERFINPDRVSPPDIDLDFADDRRTEVLEHLKDKYGEDRVAHISTYNAAKGKSAIKDVARVFGIPFLDVNQVTKFMTEDGIDADMSSVYELEEFAARHPQVVEHAKVIEGQVRQAGRHAAGVVITNVPLRELAVLESRSDEQTINWDMNDAEYLGMLKLDILGLRTCSVVHAATKLITKRHAPIDPWAVPLDDQQVLNEFGKGNTAAVFQFESPGMQNLLRNLAPIDRFEVLADATSLYRPGPKDSGLMDSYVARRAGLEDVTYVHPDLRPILSGTQGVMVYQEQVMRVAHDLAGYTWAQADSLRKVIGKKLGPAEIEKHREGFVRGCVNHGGIVEAQATKLFDQIHEFVKYGFNKAHAVEYALISYVCMWLKVHYPLEFFAAMVGYTDDADRLTAYKAEMDRLDIELLPPNLFTSEYEPTIEDRGIRLPIKVIKGIGPNTVEAIMQARQLRGYANFFEFVKAVERKRCNKRAIRTLIEAGAVARGFTRTAALLTGLDSVLAGKVTRYDDLPAPDPFITEQSLEASRREALGPFYEPAPLAVELEVESPQLAKLIDDLKQCNKCPICRHSGSTGPVPPTAPKGAMIMGVAESPGEDEDKAKAGLVGKSGRRFNAILRKARLSRDIFYLSNLYKCRPANNKLPDDPPKDCHAWLRQEIEIIKPKLIVAMGRHAAQFFGLKGGIISASGKSIWHDGFDCCVVYCVHPGYALRNPTEGNELMLRAFMVARRLLKA